MLETFPTEVLWLVTAQVTIGPRHLNTRLRPQLADTVDLKHLCEVSKLLQEAVTPRLYESVRLSATELSMATLKSQLENVSFAHLKHTRHIHLRAPFHRRLRKRCLHHDYPRLSDMTVLRRVVELGENASEDVSGHVVRTARALGGLKLQITNKCPKDESEPDPFLDLMVDLDLVLSCVPKDQLRTFT